MARRRARKPGQRKPARQHAVGGRSVATGGITPIQWGTLFVVGSLAGGVGQLAAGAVLSGAVTLALGAVVGGSLWLLVRRPRVKPSHAAEVTCPGCGSLQTDTELVFTPDGREVPEWVCFACDHRWG